MTAETIVDFDREQYKALCAEMRDVLQLEKEIAAKKKELRERIVEMAGGDRMEHGIKVQRKVVKGSVDYKAWFESTMPDEQDRAFVETNFRKPAKEYFDVRVY